MKPKENTMRPSIWRIFFRAVWRRIPNYRAGQSVERDVTSKLPLFEHSPETKGKIKKQNKRAKERITK
jgi:hypothetical protein